MPSISFSPGCAIIGSHLINLRLEQGIAGVEAFLQECRQKLDS